MEIRTQTETRAVVALKTLLYLGAAVLYLRLLATTPAIVTTLVFIVLAVLAAVWAERRKLRLLPALVVAGGVAGAAFPLGRWILDSDSVLAGISGPTTVLLSDATSFGLLAFGLVFGLRTLATRSRVFDVVEAAVVVGAVGHTFATHRNQMINRPRFLSDWAWSQGIDPQVFLHGLGVGVAVLAMLMLLRRQRVLKLIITLACLLLVAAGVYWYAKDLHVEPEIDTNGLGLTSGEQGKSGDDEADGKGGGGKPDKGDPNDGKGGDGKGKDGKGGGKGDGKGNGGGGGGAPDPPPTPVAVAVFHKDFKPENGILYFRQQVLSRYDGHRLVADAQGPDVDVITQFPHDGPIIAKSPPDEAFHVRVPTSMFLVVDHPQPLSLSGAIEISPKDNPAPRRFVAAYDVVTRALSQPTDRLLGRRSVSADWSEETRAAYLQTPDDPRYDALAQEILRDLDPRFVNDDLMKALAIKRYLEQNGFYTRKERHVDEADPAASFLFGNLRGYCVHFAHAAAHLFRSQGIASRVALGYAVSLNHRGEGSSVLITGDRAHAWPEIHVDGVGWITFDIYPEQSDETAPQVIDQGLESLLGELARKDKSAGRAEKALGDAFTVPWAAIGLWIALIVGVLLLLAYAVKVSRRVGYGSDRLVFAGTIDRFSDISLARQQNETWERYAARVSAVAPSVEALTQTHLRGTLGGRPDPDRLRDLSKQVAGEYAKNVKWWKKALGWLNPIGWWFTR